MSRKFTEAEVKFIIETANAGPQATEVVDAPSDRCRWFLTANWGLCETANDTFALGYERTRHALSWVDCHLETIGWSESEVAELVEKMCA